MNSKPALSAESQSLPQSGPSIGATAKSVTGEDRRPEDGPSLEDASTFVELFERRSGGPSAFARWAALSLVSASVANRVSLTLPTGATLFANLCVVLIGGPARRRQTLTLAAELVTNIHEIEPFWGRLTARSLLLLLRRKRPVYALGHDLENAPSSQIEELFELMRTAYFPPPSGLALRDGSGHGVVTSVYSPSLNALLGADSRWWGQGRLGGVAIVVAEPTPRSSSAYPPDLDLQAMIAELHYRLATLALLRGPCELSKQAREASSGVEEESRDLSLKVAMAHMLSEASIELMELRRSKSDDGRYRLVVKERHFSRALADLAGARAGRPGAKP